MLKKMGVLRIPREIELAGMDHRIVEAEAMEAREIVDQELNAVRKRGER